MIGACDDVEEGHVALTGALLDQLLQSLDVTVAKYRSPSARAPRDEVVQLAPVDGLPPPSQRRFDLGSQFAFHDTLLA